MKYEEGDSLIGVVIITREAVDHMLCITNLNMYLPLITGIPPGISI
jgi:hypothetical protein